MRNIILNITILALLLGVNVSLSAQCELDKCNPLLSGMEITPDCIAVGETAVLNLGWAMSALDDQSYAPAYSWRIDISLDAGLRYEYQSVVGDGFDWSYDAANVTLTGVNNVEMGLDIPNGIFFAGFIDVTIVGLVTNECVPILSGANIEIIALDQGGCPQAYSNQTADDSDDSALSVSPPNSIVGFVFHDNFADGTQGNNSGTGTGADDPIGGIPVTLKDCGVNDICGDTDDGLSKATSTLADGTYAFENLAYGNYKVCFGMDDGSIVYDEFTTMNTSGANTTDDSDASSGGITSGITLNAGNTDVEDVDAGLFQYATISGTLFLDNDGTNGTVTVPAGTMDDIVVVYCDNPTACDMTHSITYSVTTDASGNYTIDDVIPGVILSIDATTYSTFEESTVVNAQNLDAHSGGSIINQNFALPVDILYFTAIKKKDKSLLEWATSHEINNDFFEIQASQNGSDFSPIGRVDSKGNGALGNTTYEYTHENPFDGKNYYRLKQFDYDGRFEFSEIRVLTFEQNIGRLTFNAYPIPTNNSISVTTNIELENHTISIYDDLGRKLKTLDYTNQMDIDISDLTDGIYFLRLSDGNGVQVEHKRIIKMN